MQLEVSVLGKPVATLDSPTGFEHVLTYYPGLNAEDFVSLLMPVQTKSYSYPELHPLFQMNLPEGFLLSILQEQLGPHIGASPLSLLSVIGRNMIGRVQVSAPGANLDVAPSSIEVKEILKGDNGEEAFIDLVKKYATSGVSGVVPKFLSPEAKRQFLKASVATPRYIIKGSSQKLPYLALNEHLSMEVSRTAGFDTAKTEVSEDGQALLVHRFDVNEVTGTRLGMEDICSLLLLRPAQKYEATWERVVKQVKAFVPTENRQMELEKLIGTLLLTYALGNADCHAKNLALLYTSFEDVRVAPVYDMLSITVYDDYAKNPPGLSISGRKTWHPGKTLQQFAQIQAGIKPADFKLLLERICDAIVKVTPEVMAHAKDKSGFREVGKRMVHRWNEGINSLTYKTSILVPDLKVNLDAAGFSEVVIAKPVKPEKIGKSSLLASKK
ncbi:MAG: hypothetical protein CTY12_07685 [Methylotenera sp.]|nr:MAG: hypothetical protein CTY12_07685 [Methylotenera sp.]